jgi:hypothetical protein
MCAIRNLYTVLIDIEFVTALTILTAQRATAKNVVVKCYTKELLLQRNERVRCEALRFRPVVRC